jgi:ribonuclease P protein component
MSLKPNLRLRRHADYQRAYTAAGKKQHAREMTFFCTRRDVMPAVKLHPNEASLPQGPRIGLTVGKVMGKAHDRNRIKRRMRAAVALHAALLADLPVDVILHPRRSVLTLDWDKLQRDVAQVFRTIRKQCAAAPAKPATAQDEPTA